MADVIVTDDLKISVNQALQAFKNNDKKFFKSSISYIFKEIQYREYSIFCDYLFEKLKSEVI